MNLRSLPALPISPGSSTKALEDALRELRESFTTSSFQSEKRLDLILDALRAALQRPDHPPLDLSGVRSDIRSLSDVFSSVRFEGPPALPAVPPPDTDAIASALEERLGKSVHPVLAELVAQLKLMEWRLKGQSSPTLPSQIGIADPVTGKRLLIDAEGRVTTKTADEETYIDYDGRSDSNPVYIGKAPQGTAGSGSWTVQRLTYDGSSRVVNVQVLTGAWDDRSSLGWT